MPRSPRLAPQPIKYCQDISKELNMASSKCRTQPFSVDLQERSTENGFFLIINVRGCFTGEKERSENEYSTGPLNLQPLQSLHKFRSIPSPLKGSHQTLGPRQRSLALFLNRIVTRCSSISRNRRGCLWTLLHFATFFGVVIKLLINIKFLGNRFEF